MLPRRAKSPLSLLCSALTLVFAPHCAGEPESARASGDSAPAGEAGVVVSAAAWTLDWDRGGVAWDPAGGFSLTTNLGYEVHIERGFHILHGVSLAPCPAAPAPEASFLGLSVRSAAAHTADEDPSAIEVLFASDLGKSPLAFEIGASAFPPARYCRAFFLLARGMPGLAAPDGEDLSNRSVLFRGSYRRGDAQGPIDVDTWWPQGKLVEIAEAAAPDAYENAARDGETRFAFVTIRIPLGSAFEDVDFQNQEEPVMIDRVIGNLTERAEMVVDLRAP